MKIFIYSTHNLWPSHPETELEIIQGHLDKGDEVYRFVCNGELAVCDLNLEHELPVCLRCSDIGRCGKKLLDGKIKELPIISNTNDSIKKVSEIDFSYTSLEELKNISVDNFDIGYAVLSSITSMLRDPAPDLKINKQRIDLYLRSSLSIYYSTLEYIHKLKPDKIYVFNGRFAHVKPVLRSAQLCNVPCYIHERGYDKFHFELFKNTTPHDRAYIFDNMYELWNKAEMDSREKIGASFYEDRMEGKEQGWFSFTKNQHKGLLPEGWNVNKRNIAIFNSSEDEFASVGPEWKNELYETQTAGIKRIIKDCLQYPELHFYLRIHPNLIGVRNTDIDELTGLNYPNLTIISADSKVSSYDLLFNCEKVIAFGSSVGIEAVFWGKASIQAGKSYYFDMNVTYKPSSHVELLEMIFEKLAPKDKTGALIYGYYFKTFGKPFKIYQPETLGIGTYKGINLFKYESKYTLFFKKIKKIKVVQKLAFYYQKEYKKRRQKMIFN